MFIYKKTPLVSRQDISCKDKGKGGEKTFSKHVVFDKMPETLVKSRAFCVSTCPACFPSSLFPFVLHNIFCTSGKHIQTVNLRIYRYQVEGKKKKKIEIKSTPTRRAFWQALVRTAKRLDSETEVVWKRTTNNLNFSSPRFQYRVSRAFFNFVCARLGRQLTSPLARRLHFLGTSKTVHALLKGRVNAFQKRKKVIVEFILGCLH